MSELRFFVPGLPKPAGSKRAFIIRGKGRADRVAVTDASGKAGKDWRQDIRTAAFAACGQPGSNGWMSGPLAVEMTFLLPRPKHHFGSRGLSAGAPKRPTTRPDVLKLARAVEDALTGVIWADDARIVEESLTKFYASNESPGVAVRVWAVTQDAHHALPERP